MNISERDLNIIKGKVIAGHATKKELFNLIEYVNQLEILLDEADYEDFYGTEGWRRRMGWD